MRTFLFIFLLMGSLQAEEVTLESFVKELSSDDFTARKAAMEEMQTWAKENPKKALSQIPPFLKKVPDPEIGMRLREIARDLFTKDQKSLFGFRFTLEHDVILREQPVIGLLLVTVVNGSPADKGGLQMNDVIVGINGQNFPRGTETAEVRAVFANQPPGQKAKVEVMRDEQILIINVRPDAVEMTAVDQEERRNLFEKWLKEEMKKK